MSDSIIDDHSLLEDFRYKHNMEIPSIYRTCLAFNRFKIRFHEQILENTIGHVFFSKPDLNLFAKYSNGATINSQILNRYEYSDLLKTDPELFKCLQDNQGGGPFIYPLCNAITNFPTKDEIIKTRESVETANDWKIIYGHRINDSRASDTVDLNFLDDRNLTVFKLLKIWVNYIHLITIGALAPHADNRRERILDYTGSIYYFLTDETGTNIIYYCKLVGVFPVNIPSGTMAWEIGSSKLMEYNISFQYSIKDESPLVIRDFNKITGKYSSYVPTIVEGGLAPSTWVKGVYIEELNGRYKLRYS